MQLLGDAFKCRGGGGLVQLTPYQVCAKKNIDVSEVFYSELSQYHFNAQVKHQVLVEKAGVYVK